MLDKILFVDDDPNILSAFQRTLRSRFQIETADSPSKALALLQRDNGFAVVVSDYRMPTTNGVEFLSQLAVDLPNCVRVLLTGEADTKAASAAVNQGQIFRFLLKPCPPMILEKTLKAAVRHHQLLTGEKTLMTQTLQKSMHVLTELLRFTSPHAFPHSQAVGGIVEGLLVSLPIDDKWEFELSALLYELGNITLTPELLSKIASGETLTLADASLYKSRIGFAQRLLEQIPRLERVAQIIGAQGHLSVPLPQFQALNQVDRYRFGVNLLNLAILWDNQRLNGVPLSTFLPEARTKGFPLVLLKALETLPAHVCQSPSSLVKTSALIKGMTLDADLIAQNGIVLVTKGSTLSETLAECLMRRFEYYGTDEEVLVHVDAAPVPGG